MCLLLVKFSMYVVLRPILKLKHSFCTEVLGTSRNDPQGSFAVVIAMLQSSQHEFFFLIAQDALVCSAVLELLKP